MAIVALWATTQPAQAPAAGSSIDPSSLALLRLGHETLPESVTAGPDGPCTLLSIHVSRTSIGTVGIACGRAFERRIDVAPYPGVDLQPLDLDYAAGHFDVVGYRQASAESDKQPFLARVLADGTPDPTFGTAGVVDLGVLGALGTRSVILSNVESLADGSVVAAGVAFNSAKSSAARSAFVLRLTPTGQPDAAFGAGGVRVVDAPDHRYTHLSSMRVLTDGTILSIGSVRRSSTTPYSSYASLLDATGNLVPSFGGDGVAVQQLALAPSVLAVLPTSADLAFPVVASASMNVKGEIRPFILRLNADGQVARKWAGPRAGLPTTMLGDTDSWQRMFIDLAPDGTVYAAAERIIEGDFDSFVARYTPSRGDHDQRWGSFEAIDTAPGSVDDESTWGLVMDGARPYVVGVHRARNAGVYETHAFSPNMRGALENVANGSMTLLRGRFGFTGCGVTPNRPCHVRPGSTIFAVAVFPGWDPSRSPLLRPVVHVWSKQPRKAWRIREEVTTTTRVRKLTVARSLIRLGRGRHVVYADRNGGRGWSWGTTNYAYVSVP